nr:FAD:protein FMN transferase [Oceanobacter mangrovi]
MTTKVSFEILLAAEQQTAAGKLQAEQAIDAAIAEFERITSVMSEWQPGTEVSRLNAQAGGAAMEISLELYRLLVAAQQVSELSHGAFDISFRSAGKLWDFRRAEVPSEAQIAQAIQHIDYHRLVLTAPVNNAEAGVSQPPMARITDAHTSIGLGAIAKGYAIDRAVQIFRSAGYQAFAINAGGDLYVAGQHGERLWNVGIQHPRQPQQLLANLPGSNLAVATSGDYERFFIHNGKRYSHIINPKTGYPADSTQSVTIISSRAFWADALATAVSVLGPIDGMALVESLDGVEALVVDAEGETGLSSGFQQRAGIEVR